MALLVGIAERVDWHPMQESDLLWQFTRIALF